MSELVYAVPCDTGFVMFGEVETCQLTQTGAVDTLTYSFVSWLYNGTVPVTVAALNQL